MTDDDFRATGPNLFVPGAAKSATSTLHLLLDRHPDICMSHPQKEPHHFADPERARRDPQAYLALFAGGATARYRGESSTGYFVFPGVPEAIRTTCEDPRFVFVLRNPCDRTWSHYTWLRGLGYEPRGLRRAVESDASSEPDFARSWRGNYRYYSAHSDYGRQVRRFVEAFGRDRVHVITTERLRTSPDAALRSCFDFLGLPPFAIDGPEVVANRTTTSRRPFIHNVYGTVRHAPATTRWLAAHPRVRTLAGRSDSAVRRITGPTSSDLPAPRLSVADRRWLAERFAASVDELRRITGDSFADWADDFPVDHAGAGVLR